VVLNRRRYGAVDRHKPEQDPAGGGHHAVVGQPHSEDEGPIAEAEQRAVRMRSDEHPLGTQGLRFDRRSTFYLGLMASAGVAVTYAAVRVLGSASSALVLIGVAFFLALGLEPAVSRLVNRRLPRWAAVTLVVVVVFAVVAGSVAAAIPPLAEQAREFIEQVPHYIQQVQDHSSVIGRLSARYQLWQRITDTIHTAGGSAFEEFVKGATAVFGAVSDVGIVAVLTVYFLVDMPRIRATLYRFVPNSRRPRAILIGDEIMAKVGDYVFGNVVTSVIAGAATFVWCTVFGVPYPLLLGAFVALLDLLPYGSSVGGFIVAVVALTVSVPVSIATIGFYIAFRLCEDYILVPKVIGRAVKVPAVVTVVAVLIGGALLGVVGALVAIPIAAALQLLTQELVFPSLDEA
jgi:predicted PurR-regulated permease PerM